MTREQFLTRRAVMDFEQRVGVTQCPAADAAGAHASTARPRCAHAQRKARWAHVAARIVQHPTSSAPIRWLGQEPVDAKVR